MPKHHEAGRFRNLRAALLVALVCAAGLTGCVAPARGKKPLTWEALYGPRRVSFGGGHAPEVKWLPDGQHYLERRDGLLQRVNAVSDAAVPAYDRAALETALREQGGLSEGAASQLSRQPEEWNEDRTAALFQHEDRLYLYRFDAGTLKRLTEEGQERREVTLSPDAGHVAYVKDNNIYAIATDTAQAVQLTTDGSETTLNGVLDWVYQEEIYGRGNWRSYWWSKDGRHLAYLQLDEANVPIYPLVDYMPRHPELTEMRYPKAGDTNPGVRLGIVPAGGGHTVWVDLSQYSGTDILIVGVIWAPDGRLFYCVQDRESRWLDLNMTTVDGGPPRTLLHETSPAWVDYEHPPHWLDDGSFLWFSARDGWAHLYHYAADGQLLGRVTEGAWEVSDLHGVDTAGGWVYFSGMRDSPVETHAYRVKLSSGEIQRLTELGCGHGVNFAPHFEYFIDTFSNVTTPSKTCVRKVDGEIVRVIHAGDVAALREYRLSMPELLRVPGANGHMLNAVLFRPADFNRHRKYPVFTSVYGGPHMPAVRNRWQRHDFGFHQWLAQQGYLVWICDPYSASGEGAVSAWTAYQQLGVTELADLEASIRWLAEHECADLRHVVIFGHSYGGYLAAYALTHGSVFTTGIAVATLTDWRNYDTVYAEKLMRTPEHNPEGYDKSSVVVAAGKLHGRLLLLHGVVDENVHLQNVLQLMDALQNAQKDFELMLYPRDDHGVNGYYEHGPVLGMEFLKRALQK